MCQWRAWTLGLWPTRATKRSLEQHESLPDRGAGLIGIEMATGNQDGRLSGPN
jgi:hypothetical protein